ncbi:MAG: hypothetical protein IJP63_00085 [Acholeplasmatales bacterium]|nr:hypothetical protein [Acholeplasmatales bacterium]
MYDYDYEYEDGLSLLDLMKVSFGTNKKARIRFGIVLLAMAVITYLAIGVIYNGRKVDYTANFQYQIPSLIEKENNEGVVSSVSYLDGTPFNVNSLTTLSHLKEVKDSNPEFSNIDVETMYEKTHIKASYNSSNEYQYSISARERYFSSEGQAKKFINALLQLPLTVSSKLVDSIDNSVFINQATEAGNSLVYEINTLINQATYITETYETLVATMALENKTKVSIDGNVVEISALKVDADNKLQDLSISLYLTEVESKHYVRNYSSQEVKDELTTIYNNYLAESSELQKKIDNYNSMIQAGAILNANYENYVKCMDRKIIVDHQVEVYEGFVNHGVESAEFEARLANAVSTLRSITDDLTKVQKSIYKDSSNAIYFAKNNIVEETGDINIFIVIVAALVLGVIVAAIVNLIMGYSKFKEEKFQKLDTKKEETKTENE